MIVESKLPYPYYVSLGRQSPLRERTLFDIMPGNNEVTADELKVLEKNKGFQARKQDGSLRVKVHSTNA